MNCAHEIWDRHLEIEDYHLGKVSNLKKPYRVSRQLAYFRRFSICRQCGSTSMSGRVRINRDSLPLTGQACRRGGNE